MKTVYLTIGQRTAIVPLTKGFRAIIDAADIPLIELHFWHVRVCSNERAQYAVGAEKKGKGQVHVSMHRVITGAKLTSEIVDHINGDGLDNRRSNLRITSRSINTLNCFAPVFGRSRFRGVYFFRKRWHAKVGGRPKQTYVGSFATEVEAAQARDAAALVRYGSVALMNFPVSGKATVQP